MGEWRDILSAKFCDVCGAPADGRCLVQLADGVASGYLCERDAEDMAALLDEWEPFVGGAS